MLTKILPDTAVFPQPQLGYRRSRLQHCRVMQCVPLIMLACTLTQRHVQNRFMIIFGGGSVANCYNDVIMLDTKTLEWSTPQITGTPPTPRAGSPCHRTLPCEGVH